MTWTEAFRSIDELPPIGTAYIDPAATVAYEEAHREGFDTGLAEGRARGEALGRAEAGAAVLAQSHTALDAVIAAAADLRGRDEAGLATLAEFAVDLALSLAQTIIGREIDTAIDPGRDALVRALAVAPTSGDVVARLHPEDLAALGGVDQLVDGRALRLVSDPAVGRGGCLLDVGPSRVNATIEAAIDRVRAELAGTPQIADAISDQDISDLGGGA
jgi:flagellar assembly protein FliH